MVLEAARKIDLYLITSKLVCLFSETLNPILSIVLTRSVSGGIVAPPKSCPSPALQSVALFGTRVSADTIKLKIS